MTCYPDCIRSRVLGVAILLCASNASCIDEPGGGPPRPVRLALGLSSYASLPEIRAQLGAHASWTVVEKRFPARGTCPRFDETVVVIPSLRVHSFTGRAELELINDRLFRVRFIPDDADGYARWLETPSTVADAAVVPRSVVGASALPGGPRGGRSWLWSDPKISAERSAWVEWCA